MGMVRAGISGARLSSRKAVGARISQKVAVGVVFVDAMFMNIMDATIVTAATIPARRGRRDVRPAAEPSAAA